MPEQQPRQFGGTPRFNARPPSGSWQSSATVAGTPQSTSRQTKMGIGLGRGLGSKGLGKSLKRHRKMQRDTIQGITKGDIRRLARRGGIKRISATVYSDIRIVIKKRLEMVLSSVIPLVEHSNRKTVSVTDVIFALNRLGTPIYGFTPTFDGRHRT